MVPFYAVTKNITTDHYQIMNSIEAMYREIESQSSILTSLRLPRMEGVKDCIFVGSGDSFVAGLISSYVSGFRSLCLTPQDIIAHPQIAKGRHVFFVSVSGNTIANIRGASALKARHVPVTAITMNVNSLLAKECRDVIEIDVPRSPVVTSGTLTFTASAIICLSLISNITNTALIPKIYEKCKKNYQIYDDIAFNGEVHVVLGDDLLYPCAIYGKLKINEIFGFPSVAYSLDEFFHASLFGTRASDSILVLETKEIRQKRKKNTISELLSKIRLKNVSLSCGSKSVFETIFTSIFLQQLIFVNQARKMGINECSFLKNKRYLSISSKMIYGPCYGH